MTTSISEYCETVVLILYVSIWYLCHRWRTGSAFTVVYSIEHTALWTLSGTTRVSWCQKVHFTRFWIFWCKMKITQADTPTIRMDCHPNQTNWCPHLCHPHHFYTICPSWHHPIYPGLGQAPNMLACIPGGLVVYAVYSIEQWWLICHEYWIWQIDVSYCWCAQWPCTRHEVVCEESRWRLVQRHTCWCAKFAEISVRGTAHFLTVLHASLLLLILTVFGHTEISLLNYECGNSNIDFTAWMH